MKKQRKIWLCIGILVLLAVLTVSVFLIVPAFRKSGVGGYKPIKFDANESPEALTGSSHEYIVGPVPYYGRGYNGAPPEFKFETDFSFAVKAKVVENYPDIYYKLDAYDETDYRLIEMETIEVLRGEGIPKNFFYLMPDWVYVDMSGYDSLLISMDQLGTENYTIKNKTKQRVEALDLPVFCDRQDYPALGNIMAFTDGIFDESLWKTESWAFGYQFGESWLDHPKDSHLVVSRGACESDVIANIRAQIEEDKVFWGEEFPDLRVQTLDFSAPEIKEALDYVAPFRNGVFLQRCSSRSLTYIRYINGCETEEQITIDLENGTVTYSDVRYTEEDMAQMEDLSAHLASLAEEYSEKLPVPPHTNPAGKELLELNMTAWYTNADGKLYGVIRTFWEYANMDDFNERYMDGEYVLYDMSEWTARAVSADELTKIVGDRNVLGIDYGEAISLPIG